MERDAAAEKRGVEPEREGDERISARDAAGMAPIAHALWMSERDGRDMQRQISRAGRRYLARQRAPRFPR